jgi:phosphoenolpyruvate-protein kinase (PTS system EI component)
VSAGQRENAVTAPDQASEIAELRGLIREAHGAIKDMERLLREIRQANREGAEQARAAAQQAAKEEMTRFQEHIQAQMDESARDLNRAVEAARTHVVRQLTVSEVESGPDGKGLRVKFAGNLFDAGEDPS